MASGSRVVIVLNDEDRERFDRLCDALKGMRKLPSEPLVHFVKERQRAWQAWAEGFEDTFPKVIAEQIRDEYANMALMLETDQPKHVTPIDVNLSGSETEHERQ